jgi:hypothetical protein
MMQNSGNIYVAFMLNVSVARTGDFFLALSPSTNQTDYYSRVYAKSSGAGYVLGIRKYYEGSDATYGSTVLTFGSTYLVVLKYQFVASTKNDSISLFVFADPTLPATEPATPEVGPYGSASQADPGDLDMVTLLQRSTSGPTLVFDGLRVGGSWDEAPLPVEINSFSATADHLTANLAWSTISEVNNHGFDVERRSGVDGWSKVGFVKGAGTSSSLHTYVFSDYVPLAGLYEYRIRQIDNHGTSQYSKNLQVEIGAVGKLLSLSANYPNPFNPVTNIDFSVPGYGRAELKVYNALGQEVATLFNGGAAPGQLIRTTFDGASLTSGVYFYRLKFQGTSHVRPMVLMK